MLPKEINEQHLGLQVSDDARLGEGNFGAVYKAQLKQGALGKNSPARIVAVKFIPPESPDSTKEDLFGEAMLMTQFKHQNVLPILGVVSRVDKCMIILEYRFSN